MDKMMEGIRWMKEIRLIRWMDKWMEGIRWMGKWMEGIR